MTLVIYTDASFRGRNKNTCGLATIIKVAGGPIFTRTTLRGTAVTSHEAECQAAVLGLTLAGLLRIGQDRDMREVILVSDSESLVLAVQNRKRSKYSAHLNAVIDAVDQLAGRAQAFRAEHRTERSDPEMKNVDYMSKMLLVTQE